MPIPPVARRQVHLDFHTGPAVPDVGADFDGPRFARTFKDAHVDSVTVFAKCHHGHLYYRTDDPARHPNLVPGLDLCGEQVKALHAVGIRAPIYMSVQCDEFAANAHPDWVARNPDGTNVGPAPLNPGWQILDMSGPYRAYLAAQLEDLLRRYAPVDGLFFDMCWNQPSVSKWAKAGMDAAGLDPRCPDDRQTYAARVAASYMAEYHAIVKKHCPDATVYFNSRPLGGLADDIAYLTHTEIEALPTGGWGYMYFPRNVRYVRTFGRPYLGMTGRFHKSWGDFGSLKPYAALLYEVTQMLAHGAVCSIGDQLHPRGAPLPAVYDEIGRVYAHAEACGPWTADAKPRADIGLFRLAGSVEKAGDVAIDDGATRLLTQLKHQFDCVNAASDWSPYRVLILPDAVAVDAAFAGKLNAYVAAGGKLLLTGTSGLDADGRAVLDLGADPQGESPYQTVFLRFRDGVAPDVPRMDHVVYDRTWRAVARADATPLADVTEPYFDRDYRHFCSHAQTPNRPDPSAYTAGAVRADGAVAYSPLPLFGLFARHAYAPYRALVAAALDRLLPEPLLRVNMPLTGEATVLAQNGRTIVHLLQFVADRRGDLDICEDIVPLRDVRLSLRADAEPKRVTLAPQNAPAPFTWRAGRVDVVVPEIVGHQMVVVE